MSENSSEGTRRRLSVSEMRQKLADQQRSEMSDELQDGHRHNTRQEKILSNDSIRHSGSTNTSARHGSSEQTSADDTVRTFSPHPDIVDAVTPLTSPDPGKYVELERPRETRIRWGLFYVVLALVIVIGLAIGIKALVDTLNSSREPENQVIEISTQNLTSKELGCQSPSNLPSLTNSMYARPRQDETAIRVGPGLDCTTLATVDRGDRVIVLSGSITVDGQPWILVREYRESDDLAFPNEGWVPEESIVFIS